MFIRELRSRVLPQFAHLGDEAEQFAQAEYQRICQLLSSDDEPFDAGDAAEQANDSAITWYQMMCGVRQSLVNLHAVGLRHLFEQQLYDFVKHTCLSSRAVADFPKDCKAVESLGFCLSDLPSWEKLEELRQLSNSIKHAEGRSSTLLKKSRPDLFIDPVTARLPFIGRPGPTIQPLAGEDIYLKEEDLDVYCSSVRYFWFSIGEILDYQDFK